MAEIVANQTGFNQKPIYVKDRPQEVKIATCNADKARKFLNYKTQVTIEKSIEKSIKFIKERGLKKFEYNLPLEIVNKKTPLTWKNKII